MPADQPEEAREQRREAALRVVGEQEAVESSLPPAHGELRPGEVVRADPQEEAEERRRRAALRPAVKQEEAMAPLVPADESGVEAANEGDPPGDSPGEPSMTSAGTRTGGEVCSLPRCSFFHVMTPVGNSQW